MITKDTTRLAKQALQMMHARQFAEAGGLYAALCQAEPANADAWFMFGMAKANLNDPASTANCMQRCLQLRPDHAEAHYRLGFALQLMGHAESAATCYQQALQLQPRHAGALENLGTLQLNKGDHTTALDLLRKAVRLRPKSAEGQCNLGLALSQKGDFENGATHLKKALRLNPELPEAHNNLSLALVKLGRLREAVKHCRAALKLRPEFHAARSNLGNFLQELGDYDAALEEFDKVLAATPENAEAHWNRSLLLLQRGEFEKGWEDYEWRWRRTITPPRNLSKPIWDGGPVEDKRILVHAEQGLGDTIQFARYTNLLGRRGAHVTVECPASLAPLMATCEGVNEVVPPGSPLPEYDVHIPMLSLPGRFQTRLDSIPAQTPYLSVPEGDFHTIEEAIRSQASQCDIAVGIVWSGRIADLLQARRSCKVRDFLALSQFANITLFSLQKGTDDKLDSLPVVDLGGPDFSHTAAAIECLDLVISIDTSVAHLAGGLGKPVWLLLPWVSDWRWLLEREDSPWYPTMRLFRQEKPGDWKGVFKRVGQALSEWPIVTQRAQADKETNEAR